MDDLARLRSEGDLNLSPRRARWQEAQLDGATRELVEEVRNSFERCDCN